MAHNIYYKCHISLWGNCDSCFIHLFIHKCIFHLFSQHVLNVCQCKMCTSFFLITEIFQNVLSWAFCSQNFVCLFVYYCFLVNMNTSYWSSGTKTMDLMLCELWWQWIALCFVGLQNFCVITVSRNGLTCILNIGWNFSQLGEYVGLIPLKLVPWLRSKEWNIW